MSEPQDLFKNTDAYPSWQTLIQVVWRRVSTEVTFLKSSSGNSNGKPELETTNIKNKNKNKSKCFLLS